MQDIEREKIVYNALKAAFSEDGFSNIVIDNAIKQSGDETSRGYVTRLFYGVLENSIKYDYIISSLCEKKPKNALVIMLKMGMYLLYESDTPDYAAVSKIVDLCKAVGKSASAGYVNAVLKNAAKFSLPNESDLPEEEFLSIKYSWPQWAIGKLIRQYGIDRAKEIISTKPSNRTHIRPNTRKISQEQFELLLKKSKNTSKTTNFGYYVRHTTLNSLNPALYTAQGYSSMLAVHSYLDGLSSGAKVLDLCGAPGGKSIYLDELIDADITICDIHDHRLELIRSYCRRMGAEIKVKKNDASVLNNDWIDAFDCVILDVPCSGIGVAASKPDVLLRKSEADVLSLAQLQKKMIKTASKYVKVGGFLNYSTCTLFEEENERVIFDFLSDRDDFVMVKINSPYVKSDDDGFVRIFPDNSGQDGFFVAKLMRVK